MVKELSLPYYFPIAGRRVVEFMPSPRVLVLWETQTALSRIWTLVIVSISYVNNYHSLSTSYCLISCEVAHFLFFLKDCEWHLVLILNFMILKTVITDDDSWSIWLWSCGLRHNCDQRSLKFGARPKLLPMVFFHKELVIDHKYIPVSESWPGLQTFSFHHCPRTILENYVSRLISWFFFKLT